MSTMYKGRCADNWRIAAAKMPKGARQYVAQQGLGSGYTCSTKDE